MTSHSKQCVIFYSSNTLPEEIKISKWPLHASFFTYLLIRALRSISIFFFFSNNDNKQLPLKQLMMLTILYNMESILWFMSSSIIIKEKQKLMLLESSTSYIVQACNWSKKKKGSYRSFYTYSLKKQITTNQNKWKQTWKLSSAWKNLRNVNAECCTIRS